MLASFDAYLKGYSKQGRSIFYCGHNENMYFMLFITSLLLVDGVPLP